MRWVRATASWEMSTAVTWAAPAWAQLRAKAPVWVKQSSTFRPGGQGGGGPAVVFLVQEEAGFLAVDVVHVVPDAVFLQEEVAV